MRPTNRVKIKKGFSESRDVKNAVDELVQSIYQPDAKIVLFFYIDQI